MLHRRKAKVEVLNWKDGQETNFFDRLRYASARKLCIWNQHRAGGGSLYVTIGESLKLRFADHENTSAYHCAPDYNFVNRDPTEQELIEIEARIQHARLCKKTAFAKHVGLTVPKMKKLLTPDAYEKVCENQAYRNTYTEFVVVAIAYARLELAGITDRLPVPQEFYGSEDYSGY